MDVITIFGHSLSSADYSYFETLFDMYDIYHKPVKLEIYYWPGKDGVKKDSKRTEAIRKVVNLLETYGTTLDFNHGEDLVNRLMLEQRLNVIPMPQFKLL